MNTPKKALKILIVDDEPDIRTSLVELISENPNVTVVAAKDGAEGMWKLKNDEFDLVITDLSMPKMSGTELVTQILKKDSSRNPPKTIFLYSAFISDEFKEKLKSSRVKAFTKPDGLQSMLEEIRKISA